MSEMNATQELSDQAPLATRVNHHWTRLSRAERVVARYMVASPPQQIMLATADDIAKRTGTSDATVVRTARRLGYAGLPALKTSLGADFPAEGPPQFSVRLAISQSASDVVESSASVVSDALRRVRALSEELDPAQLTKALELIASAGEVFCYGWGVNELAARYLALKLNRIGKRSRAAGTTGYTFADDLLTLSSHHAVVIFAPERVLPDLELLVAHAKATGASMVLVTCAIEERIIEKVDAVLIDQGPGGGLSAEPLCSLLLCDMLILGAIAVGKEPAVNSYSLLARLRKEIIGGDV